MPSPEDSGTLFKLYKSGSSLVFLHTAERKPLITGTMLRQIAWNRKTPRAQHRRTTSPSASRCTPIDHYSDGEIFSA